MTAMTAETDHHNDAAQARKRRIELRSKQRQNEDEPSQKRVCIRVESSDEEYQPDPVSSEKPSIRGIKTGARYNPGVPMTKEELVAWRKEARRVRNRESAAASRKRTRDRIEELEGEVSAIKVKYSAALKRIMELEAANGVHHKAIPATVTQDASLVSPSPSVASSPALESSATPSFSSPDSFTLVNEERQDQEAMHPYQHINEMISRPNAAKITGADTFAHPFDNPAPPPTIYESLESSDVTSDLSSSSSSSDDDNHEAIQDDELGNFLLEALSGFDAHADDVVEAVAL